MKLTVFGATGGTGRHVVEQALAAGHHVTAVVRDPARLTSTGHPRLEPVVADVMDTAAPEAVVAAVTGGDAVISALGPRPGGGGSVCADGARAIIAAMRAAGTRRLVVVTASGHIVDSGDGPVSRLLVKPMLQRLLREGFADFVRTDDAVRASGLDWTIMRPPRLTDGRRKPYRTAVDVNVRGGILISRADLADAILATLAVPETVGHTVSLGY
ncbi:NAD(P)-dependent oxidoreductase [Streptosporangium jomthongense]|uniref:NAD(P)-dependent oxidoreductase n=1 Tax=Streptosporangium jomthongense TaxID=1193683 RepID=A0ABV8EU84_9ACTN